jgi:hypothetical protein
MAAIKRQISDSEKLEVLAKHLRNEKLRANGELGFGFGRNQRLG